MKAWDRGANLVSAYDGSSSAIRLNATSAPASLPTCSSRRYSIVSATVMTEAPAATAATAANSNPTTETIVRNGDAIDRRSTLGRIADGYRLSE
jgi:hypothetical protein